MLWNEIYKNNKYLIFKPKSQLLIFATPEKIKKTERDELPSGVQNWKIALREIADIFSKQSSIHGLDKVFCKKLEPRKRTLWLIAFLAALTTCCYVCTILADRYNDRTFVTVIDNTQYPVYKIPFPEVTICNRNRLNWQRLNAAQLKFLHAQDLHSLELRALFARILALYDDMVYANFESFQTLSKESLLPQLNYINFTNVVDFMSWRCDEIFHNCTWRNSDIDCCAIFLKRRSQLGQCLAFNTVEAEEGARMLRLDELWPWHNGQAGPKSGLTLRVELNEASHYGNSTTDKGITIMLGEPYVYNSFPMDVSKNTRTTIGINAVMHFYDDYTRRLSSSLRECVFADEQNSIDFKTLRGHKYMFENCQSECQQEYLIKYCNCTLDLLFPPAQYRVCKLVDMPCLAKYNSYLLYIEQIGESEYVFANTTGIVCKCFLNCYSLTYINDLRSMMLNPSIMSETTSIVDLDIYYMADYILVYRTNLIYTWADLMVSFGGIVGLFLGCSLISAVELTYFLMFDMPEWMLQNHKNTKKINAIKSKNKRQNIIKVLPAK